MIISVFSFSFAVAAVGLIGYCFINLVRCVWHYHIRKIEEEFEE